MLYNTPLWSPVHLPPENSEIIILCSHDDIQHVHDVFSTYTIRLIISDKHKEEKFEINNTTVLVTSDFMEILNYSHCYIIIFGVKLDLHLLQSYYARLAEIKIRHAYIHMPIPKNLYEAIRYDQEFYEKYKNALDDVYNILEDDESRMIFASRIKSILTGDIG
jgi:hypothetical protein